MVHWYIFQTYVKQLSFNINRKKTINVITSLIEFRPCKTRQKNIYFFIITLLSH